MGSNPGHDNLDLCHWARHLATIASLHPGVSMGTGSAMVIRLTFAEKESILLLVLF